MDELTRTPLTTVHRVPQRASYDRAVVDAILDEGLVCHVGLVADGQPLVIPMAYARRGRELFLHGARASRLLGVGGAALPLCVTVTLLDGLVLARSAYHHSMNYRSVVIVGAARELTDAAEKVAAMNALVDHALPGRAAQARPPSDKELHATRVLSLAIEQASAKVRAGGPLDDDADAAWPCWAGHVPVALTAAAPIPTTAGLPVGAAPPDIVSYARQRRDGT
jgi:nitroimidazol reductase NimA-like FMN-containing flavoprotein (pyridoxamine 5'-phosphate oxidase superfamily)